MTTLLWGNYGGFEGFYTYGPSIPPPLDGSVESELLHIICRTEGPGGGTPSAVNAFDQCMISIGYLQLCQTFFLSTDLLGYLKDKSVPFTPTLQKAFQESSVTFQKNAVGRYRMFNRNGKPVETKEGQQEVFFGPDCNGRIGSWKEHNKDRAKLWVLGLQETLIQPEAIKHQIQFLLPRIMSWVTKRSRDRLWGPNTPPREAKGWVGAVRAMFLSYSVNNSVIADANLASIPESVPLFTEEGFVTLARALVFNPGNPAIYPKRYEDIRPAIERIYGVNLPDNRKDLQTWSAATMGLKGGTTLPSVKEVQKALLVAGADLGPKGADGIEGPKTKAAIRKYQEEKGLPVNGIADRMTLISLGFFVLVDPRTV